MMELKLTKGKFAIVDDEDYDFLMQWKWYLHPAKDKRYAQRTQHTAPTVTLNERSRFA